MGSKHGARIAKLSFGSTLLNMSAPTSSGPSTSSLQVQVLIWDPSLYDPDRGEYTVDRFLEWDRKALGQSMPRSSGTSIPTSASMIEISLTFFRICLAGLDGLHHLVEQFHNRGVKVFFPFLAWDTGTREKGDLPAALSKVNSKTSGRMELTSTHSKPFRRLFAKPPTLSMCPSLLNRSFNQEMSPSLGPISHGMTGSPGEGRQYPFVPMVSKTKWLEPRHSVIVTDRFTRDKTDSLQHAFFNGLGYAVLENLWGFWYGMNPNDAEAVLRFTSIERAMADNLPSPNWQPHAATLQEKVSSQAGSQIIRALYGRSSTAMSTTLLALSCAFHSRPARASTICGTGWN